MRRIPITPVNRSGKDADPEHGLVHGDVAGRGRGVPFQDQMARIVDEAQGRGYQGEVEHPAIVAFLLNEVSVRSLRRDCSRSTGSGRANFAGAQNRATPVAGQKTL